MMMMMMMMMIEVKKIDVVISGPPVWSCRRGRAYLCISGPPPCNASHVRKALKSLAIVLPSAMHVHCRPLHASLGKHHQSWGAEVKDFLSGTLPLLHFSLEDCWQSRKTGMMETEDRLPERINS